MRKSRVSAGTSNRDIVSQLTETKRDRRARQAWQQVAVTRVA